MMESEPVVETKRIKFLRTKSPYTVGEIAVFPGDKADDWIQKGIAKELKKKKKKKQLRESGYITKG